MTRVVAVDLDGTLVPYNSFRRWIRRVAAWALVHGRVLLAARLAVLTGARALRVIDHARWKRSALRAARTVPASVAAELGARVAADARPDVVQAVEAERRSGATVALVTAAPDLYVGAVASLLGASVVAATPGVVDVAWQEAVGDRKLEQLERAVGGPFVLDTVFSDHADDLPLLRRARRPVLVGERPEQRHRIEAAGVTLEPPPRAVAGRAAVGAVIVAYGSDAVVERAVDALLAGTVVPDPIVVVDNGATDPGVLDRLSLRSPSVRVVRLGANTGFCVANNVGLKLLDPTQHVLFLNPDAFVTPDFVAGALAVLDECRSVGAVGPKLLGFDPGVGSPTGRIDSAGIVQSSWGRFRDRGQGEVDRGQHDDAQGVAALCAAALLCRREALSDVALPGGQVFDERFHTYKEDLDLSFRLVHAGWELAYEPRLTVHHCRGWQRDRQAMSGWARRRSWRNEWRLWRRGIPDRRRVTMLPYLLAKSVAVLAGR